ncbi:MAG: tetratricopeptide repeat protein [Sedimentisphaerales bacterium]|nr:tetratricopeptide repeat protein [Sedimentisphaerales bacterium]MBN2841846.1 tetratricopeptide repeat protein [Sedimentisphaerales bacterium]
MKTIYLQLLVMVMLVSGCGLTSRQVVTLPVQVNNYAEVCRLDHYSCNDNSLFEPGMAIMNDLLANFRFAAADPYQATIGLGCLIDARQQVVDGRQLWFINLELEFYELANSRTIRKTVLQGHADSGNDAIDLIAGMASQFFNKVAGKGVIVVPVAIGRTDFDKAGRSALAAGDYDNALVLFQSAIDKKPDDHAARYNLGLTYEMLGRNEQAMSCYRKADELHSCELYGQAIVRINDRRN